MNRRVGMAILASIFAVMGAACSQGAGEGAAVGTGRIVAPVSKVTVGLDDQFPPMTFRDEKNEFIGFDVDMAREAAKRVGCDSSSSRSSGAARRPICITRAST